MVPTSSRGKLFAAAAFALLNAPVASGFALRTSSVESLRVGIPQQSISSPTCLHMQPARQGSVDRFDPLKVASSSTIEFDGQETDEPISASLLEDTILPVLWTSLLVTSNTVGAGMLVLPELCAGPGMGISMGLFSVLYVVNLLSGLIIAEVAVSQREASGKDAPSSFKAFSEANIDIPYAKDVIAVVSVVKNALVLAFGTYKAGDLGHEILGLDPNVGAVLWAAAFSTLVGTQSAMNLSKAASMLVVGLFASFAAILLPGLANVHDPAAVMSAPGTSPDIMGSVMHATPVILMSFIFQNIVPTVARVLEYDRMKIAGSMVLGSFLPFLMYMAWCVAVLGDGVDTAVGMGGPLFTVFSVITIAGSQLGSTTSMAEEVETYLDKGSQSEAIGEASVDKTNMVFSWESVVIPTVTALGLGQVFANDLTDLLKIAGAYGSPFLYFFLPAAMAFQQQQKLQTEVPLQARGRSMVPGGNLSFGISAAVAAGFVGSEVFQTFFSSTNVLSR